MEVKAKLEELPDQRAQGAPARRPDPRQERGRGPRRPRSVRRSASRKPLAKLVRSALANAEDRNNREKAGIDLDNLIVGADLRGRRGRACGACEPRAQGRAAWIQRKTSHVERRTRRGVKIGSEGPSLRFPDRHALRLAVELVLRRAAMRSSCTRTSRFGSFIKKKLYPRGHLEGRDRPHRRQGRGEHPHRAPGHPDRQARRRGRGAARGAREALREQARSSSTSRRSGRPSSTRSSSRRTSRSSSSAAWRSGAR